MVMYEDACADAGLYVRWLERTCTREELAEQVGGVLRDGGYGVTEAFLDALARLDVSELAAFKAANFPFERSDHRWLAHCARVYAVARHPSLTAAERNGAPVRWR